MYIPNHYLETDKKEITDFIKTYNFATIVTVKDNYQSATHLPFVINETENGLVLISHFSKANPQWRELMTNNTLVIFCEPHAYISPKHYDSEVNVPTWNYIAVHVYGRGEVITDAAETREVLESAILNFEPEYKAQWDKLPEDYKSKMQNGIVAFKIHVTDIQAKKKLSQNKKENERQRIISTLSKSSNTTEQSLAGFMKKNENDTK